MNVADAQLQNTAFLLGDRPTAEMLADSWDGTRGLQPFPESTPFAFEAR